MKLLLLACALVSSVALAQCPQPSGADMDGTAFCPGIVTASSAYAVYRCALDEAKSFHEPSKDEKGNMHDMLAAFQRKDVKALRASADNLGLQVCRVKSTDDSYLLVYTKPGVHDYSGTFFMLREVGASKVIIISPHDDSDGTFADTKIALDKSHALMTISNGHRRQNGDGRGDFVHDPIGSNLGGVAVSFVGDMFPGFVWLHVHGMQDRKHVLYRGRNDKFNKAYEKAIKDNTRIEAFKPLNADFTVDKVVNSDFYIKTEIPAAIHQDNFYALSKIVKQIEGEPWAWPGHALAALADLATPWSPPMKPVAGHKTLTCVSITYADGKHLTDRSKCRDNAQMVADFYKHNSRGLLEFEPSGREVTAAYASADSTEGKDMALIKARFPSDYWILPRYQEKSSHAGSKIAWIHGQLIWDSSHEVGHLLGLGHSGVPGDQYGDRESVMGNHQSNLLTAPQYYYMGWTPPSEVAVFDPAVSEYTLKKLNEFGHPGISVVVINPSFTGGQAGFVSFGEGLEYHVSNGGGSTLIAKTQTEYIDPSGLEFKVLSKDSGTLKISIKVGVVKK